MLIYTFIFIFFRLSSKYTFYFTYIANLNYWETNIYFIIIILYFFFSTLTSIFNFSFFFFSSNSIFFQTSLIKTLIPTLVIGTVAIHPIAFYMFTCIYLYKLFSKRVFLSFFTYKLSTNRLALYLFITLMLGGLWATQSMSWGYFWVNDLVEWLLLVVVLCLVIRLHVWVLNSNVLVVYLYSLLLVNFLILIRLNFFSTRHSFISSNSVFILIFFFYCTVFYNFIKSFYKTGIVSRFIFSLFFFLIFFCGFFYLIFYKFVYIFLFLLILNKKIIGYVTRLKSHLVLLLSLFLWFIFFKFFFLNYSYINFVKLFEVSIFNNFLSLNNPLIFNGLSLVGLESIDFSLTTPLSLSYVLLKNLALFSVLNNLTFLYLLLILFIFKIGWI